MLIEGIHGLNGRRCPVVIVGSGPVGLACAAGLTKRGVDVLLLESGSRGADEAIQELSAARRIEPARHDDMLIAVARRLGGTSNLWGARCLPYDPVDFERRPDVPAHWPIGYEALAPYWSRATQATCSGEAVFHAGEELIARADDSFTSDAIERWANIQAAQDIYKKPIAEARNLEVRTCATVTGITFGENGRVESLSVADSRSGEGAIIHPDRLILAAGGVETTRLLLAAQRDCPDRFGGADGALGRYYMGHVIGEIADIEFASPALARAFDFYVDAHGSYARRRLQPSAGIQHRHGLLNSAFWPVVPPVADPRHGDAILSMVYLAMSVPTLGRMLTAEAIRLRHVPPGPQKRAPHVKNLVTGIPAAAKFGVQFLRDRYFRKERLPGFFVLNRSNRYGLSYHGEQVPSRTSRIWLADSADRLGVPRVEIDLRFAQKDVDSLVRTHDLLDDWLQRSNAGRLEYRMPLEQRGEAILAQAAHGTHQIGLTRMGIDRRDGVVDGDLRAFDSDNLYVASTAVLPTSSQANPTLTSVALAIRLADHIAAGMGAS
jgi:choline dehydrogenase-like flavoprotein